MNPTIAIVSAVRTAIGNFGGALKDVSSVDLGAAVIRAAIVKAGIAPDQLGEVVMGNVYQAGSGPNPARTAAVRGGVPYPVPAMTINKVCGSGLKAAELAAQSIQCGQAQIALAGGMESMSQTPYLLPKARWGERMGHGKLVDSMIHDALWDGFYDCHMGTTAENLAKQYKISREEQDEYAVLSQARCKAAQESARFAAEICPVEIPQRKGTPVVFDKDEFPRGDTTVEQLAKLRPAFDKDGTVTAGNSSGINDGAATLLLAGSDAVKTHGLRPLAFVRGFASFGVDPSIMGIGPVGAIRKVLAQAGKTLDDIDLFEVNEAFAAQTLAVERELKWDRERVNVNGGAIALGHPVGASGARVLVTLVHEMQRRESKLGIAALCIGGGMGIATLIESAD